MRDVDRSERTAIRASGMFLSAVYVVADRGAVEAVPPAGDPRG